MLSAGQRALSTTSAGSLWVVLSPVTVEQSPSRVSAVVNNLVFFAWWERLRVSVENLSRGRRLTLLISALAAGVVARLWAQSLPGNWDFGQWINISNAVLEGVDPYSTYGYNYPVPWLMLLAGFQAGTIDDSSFRLLIAVLLTLTDIGICIILARRGYLLAGVLYILSPISIAISGQHQQVESIALFLAFAAAAMLSGRSDKKISPVDWAAALLIGLSLAFKPIFLLFPLWLFLRQGPIRRRVLLLMTPLVVLGISVALAFIPYSPTEVIQRIFGHGGTNNAPFVNAFVPDQLAPWVIESDGAKLIFVMALVACAWLFRRLDVFEMSLGYTVSAVLFAWAVANQYLLTPMAAVAVYLNIGFLIWLLLATIYLGGNANVLNLWGLREIQPHVMLDWTKVFQDLFPWLSIGWIVMVFTTSRRSGRDTFTGAEEGERNDVA